MVKPTVPKADTTSNNILINDMFGLIIVSSNVTMNMKVIEMLIVTIDSLIDLSDISLLNKQTLFSLRIAFNTNIKTIANVVTLIPPAALRGAPQ